MEAVRQRRRPGRAHRQSRGAARRSTRSRDDRHEEDGTTEVTPPKPEDIEKAAHELHEIQERWKQVAEAPRAQAQALWHRYRQAADPIQAKAREFFAQRAEERGANLKLKMALIERAEALADSTDWIKTADELKKLQAEWQQVGPVPRQDTKIDLEALPRRVRPVLHPPQRRPQRAQGDLDRQPREEGRALRPRRRTGRLARVGHGAASEIRRLQAEWKTIGPVRRTKSEAIWQRFRTACDTFFDRYKRRDEIELEAKHADREALVVELEALAAPSGQEEAHSASVRRRCSASGRAGW